MFDITNGDEFENNVSNTNIRTLSVTFNNNIGGFRTNGTFDNTGEFINVNTASSETCDAFTTSVSSDDDGDNGDNANNLSEAIEVRIDHYKIDIDLCQSAWNNAKDIMVSQKH